MEKSIKGRIHSVESFGAVDGPGIRFVVFFQGCPLRCLYCHNPDSWKLADGKEVESLDLVNEIKSYKNFIKTGGVTLSGGEPLMQPEFALDIIRKCKILKFHTAIDTSGGIPLSLSKPVIDEVDMLLLDAKALDNQLFEKVTGKKSNHFIETLNYCEKIKKPIWIRHVLLPEYTLDMDKLNELAEFLSHYSCVEKVELLPFHKMGEFKWEELNEKYKLYDIEPPSADEVEKVRKIFSKYNLV